MKKFIGFLLILAGSLLILTSIMALVSAFNTFSEMGSSTENMVYTFGSIVFPLLLTVFGRWVFRKGLEFWRSSAVK